ncbi:MAG: thioredoxin family protein, partial [Akkermansia sp.]|nr:thioredoxin family protein [Akkermansia sp.]
MAHLIFPLIAAALVCPAIRAAETPWLSSIRETAEAAARGHGDVLLNFTGTDWCPACRHLDGTVLSDGAFLSWARERFILSEQIMPRKPDESSPAIAELYALMKKYRVDSFPTVLLLDESMRPYARLQGSARTPGEYIRRLEEGLAAKRKRDEALTRARRAEGPQRARLLDAALKALDPALRCHYPEIVREIEALDTRDELGYAGAAEHDRLLGEQTDAFRELCRARSGKTGPEETEETLRLTREMLEQPGLLPEVRQRVLKYHADICGAREGLSLRQRIETLRKLYQEAFDAAPDTPFAARLKPWMEHYDRILSEHPRIQCGARRAWSNAEGRG